MNATDLMIGDWLIPYGKTEPSKIESLGYQYDMAGRYDKLSLECEPFTFTYPSYCKPVPLTREVLEKNGFAYNSENGALIAYAYESYSNQMEEISLYDVEIEYENNQLHICDSNHPREVMLHLMNCNYVHELQHALRVCKIDKEIVL